MTFDDSCYFCKRMKKILKFRVEHPEGYCDFCSKKCAKQYLLKNLNDFITDKYGD